MPAGTLPRPPRLLVTPGEPAGIGGELLLMAVASGEHNLWTIDDPDRLEALAKRGNINATITTIGPTQIDMLPSGHLGVIPMIWPKEITDGVPSPENAAQVISAITDAVSMIKKGLADALITNPIQKATLTKAGFAYPGHTEYLAELDRGEDGEEKYPVMMLANSALYITPLTIHVPLRDVFALITPERITKTLRLMAKGLIMDFGIKNPRIAVTGLNPHAGESGTIGDEEIQQIIPAIQLLQEEGLHITGPHSADTLFFEDRRQDYDAVLAMYHDQALIPVKTLDFHHGVNVTLGLSFIRTSPDHGTALDQAGKFTARPDSLITAITMARQMVKHRADHMGLSYGSN